MAWNLELLQLRERQINFWRCCCECSDASVTLPETRPSHREENFERKESQHETVQVRGAAQAGDARMGHSGLCGSCKRTTQRGRSQVADGPRSLHHSHCFISRCATGIEPGPHELSKLHCGRGGKSGRESGWHDLGGVDCGHELSVRLKRECGCSCFHAVSFSVRHQW